jgi:hypothetical protein
MAYDEGMPWPLIVVAETASYLAWARKVLDDEEMDEIVDLLAADPARGVLIRGTGGVRKFRYAPEGRGKRGGVRIIYYFHSDIMPVYVLAGFAKNEKDDLTPSETNALRKLADALVARHTERDR